VNELAKFYGENISVCHRELLFKDFHFFDKENSLSGCNCCDYVPYGALVKTVVFSQIIASNCKFHVLRNQDLIIIIILINTYHNSVLAS